MTQNINTTSPSDNSEQPPQAAQVEKPAKTKPQKNLYEPYRMPMILWRLIRRVVPLIASFLKRKVVYMAKEESFQGKMGWLVRFLGAFPVKRGEADRQSLRT